MKVIECWALNTPPHLQWAWRLPFYAKDPYFTCPSSKELPLWSFHGAAASARFHRTTIVHRSFAHVIISIDGKRSARFFSPMSKSNRFAWVRNWYHWRIEMPYRTFPVTSLHNTIVIDVCSLLVAGKIIIMTFNGLFVLKNIQKKNSKRTTTTATSKNESERTNERWTLLLFNISKAEMASWVIHSTANNLICVSFWSVSTSKRPIA